MKGFNGVLALSVIGGIGLNRVILTDRDNSLDIVPADLTINAITTLPWYQSTLRPSKKIFNYVSCNDNRVNLRQFEDVTTNTIYTANESNKDVLWWPYVVCTKNEFLYCILFYVLHFVPAIAFPLGEKLMNRKPMVLKLYRKIFILIKIMKKFSLTEWAFENENSQAMANALSKEDRILFDSSLSSFQWNSMFVLLPRASSIYMLKSHLTKEHFRTKTVYIWWADAVMWFFIKAFSLYLMLNFLAKQINFYFT